MQLKTKTSDNKLRGGFYTPKEITQFILKWAFNNVDSEVELFEPSCGDGAFLRVLSNSKYSYKSITAVEINKQEMLKSASIPLKNSKIINSDFLKYCNNCNNSFDIIVGNPPFIRYQFFNKAQKKEASKIFDKVDLKYSKLTNSWVPFIIGSSQLLKEKGKMGFVVPAEILQVSYAKALRQFLARTFNKINIISFKELVFPNIQQEVVLLFCEKNGSSSHMIDHKEVNNLACLKTLSLENLSGDSKKIDFYTNKWTFYFLEQNEIDLIEKVKKKFKSLMLSKFAKVEVGITTGANPYFTVTKEIVKNYNLSDYAKPMVGRSVQVSGAIFKEKDWEYNCINGAKSYLLVLPTLNDLKKNRKALDYLQYGEENDINKGYKCRIRAEWQIIPSIRYSDALFLRRNNIFPKFVDNPFNVYTTDTMHRVTIKPDTNKRALIASYYNSLSLAFTEICGRSHGGGVLELMPNEVEEILIPYDTKHEKLLEYIDTKLRNGTDIKTILKYTDNIILKETYGFSNNEIETFNSIWLKLVNRRMQRGKKKLYKS